MRAMMPATRLLDWARPAAPAVETDWEAVYTRELPRVYNFFRYRVGPGPLAEDLTSTTFEKAWRSRSRYREERAAPQTWLLAIARNVARDHFRRPFLKAPLSDAEQVADLETPENLLARSQERRRLARLVEGLAAREREILALKYGVGSNNREIASVTGLSESNVGTILHRTVQSLREAWKASGGDR
jgi:RNA polymerase sigma-70 factor (ECF subfamily)